MESIKLDNGKYEVILNDKPWKFEALRYGETWRSLTGDNLVLAMFYRIQELEEEITELKSEA